MVLVGQGHGPSSTTPFENWTRTFDFVRRRAAARTGWLYRELCGSIARPKDAPSSLLKIDRASYPEAQGQRTIIAIDCMW